jgi:hypothetical protein
MSTAPASREVLKKYNDMKKKMSDMRTELTGACKDIFKDASQELFEAHPNLVAFGWTQYTPYFNDGDVCEFGVRSDSPFIVFTTSESKDLDYDNEFSTYRYESRWDSTLKKSTPVDLTPELEAELKTGKAVVAFLQMFDDDQFKMMFDDHAQVNVTKDGVEVEHYDHD